MGQWQVCTGLKLRGDGSQIPVVVVPVFHVQVRSGFDTKRSHVHQNEIDLRRALRARSPPLFRPPVRRASSSSGTSSFLNMSAGPMKVVPKDVSGEGPAQSAFGLSWCAVFPETASARAAVSGLWDHGRRALSFGPGFAAPRAARGSEAFGRDDNIGLSNREEVV